MLQKAPDIGQEFAHAQTRYPIDTRVAIVCEFLIYGKWQIQKVLDQGTITGWRSSGDSEPYEDAYIQTVMTDEPVPRGELYAESHPHQYDCEPITAVHATLGEILVRKSVVPLEELTCS